MAINRSRCSEPYSSPAVKASTQQRGAWAESKALKFLQQRGLNLVEKNFNCRRGEIDLIMNDNEALVFIEVRFRAKSAHVSALESVDQRKQQRISLSAEYYLQRHPEQAWRHCRFDVLGISEEAHEQEIEWIQDAFQS